MTPTISQTFTVNGTPEPYRRQTVRDLLVTHGFDSERPAIAVAVNNIVVRRVEWNTIQLQPDDRVEIIRAAAGG